jgi:bifunctional DNase/RNase
MIDVTVTGVILEPQSKAPIVLLKDSEDRRALLIWVGEFEANAIAMALEQVRTPRPLTHDLLLNATGALGARLVEVRISDMRESTFFAELVFEAEGRQQVVDARPSDAIALALKAGVPLKAAEQVMESSAVPISHAKEDEEESEQFRKFLENVKPSDFGKFGGSPS